MTPASSRRRFIGAAIAAGVALGSLRTGAAGAAAAIGDLERLPVGRWARIHQQRLSDAVRFTRQAHAGSAFDSRRGRLVIFGSDSHGVDWSNAPLFFDMATLTWSRAYPPDPPASYRVDAGVPVAGPGGDHPWAMHSFGALGYDPGEDRLIVASYPAHLEPGRFTDAVAHLWQAIRRHPTWVFEMDSERWQALPGEAVHFFPHCAAFDSARQALIGCRPDGVHALAGAPPAWRRIAEAGPAGYHTNAVLDAGNGVVLLFGRNGDSDEVTLVDPDGGRPRVMPTRGARPPPDQHVPLAFHAGRGEMVAVVDRLTQGADRRQRQLHRAETWSYRLERDAWIRHEDAGLPFSLGMNYTMEYDSRRALLLLVTSAPGAATSVWALRL